MAEETVRPKRSWSRDWVTVTQCALLLLAIALLGWFVTGAGKARPVRAQGPGPGGAGGFQGPPGPFGGRGGPQPEQKLVAQFDRNKDQRLDNDERKAAREWLTQNGVGPRGFGRRGGRGLVPGSPGRVLKPAEVRAYSNEPLYDPAVLRTVFLQFENADWEQELAAFNNTDVEVPAVATVDGKVYKDVGVHFRGMSSFMMVPEGSKRSLNLTFDFVEENQNLGGYRTLNLLNVNSDPTFVRPLLYADVARSYIPAPRSNYMRVVINGESWGVYINAQQFNKDFLRDNYQTDKGARWKVPGSPGGRGGLEYLGDDPAAYKTIYEIKTKDDPKDWADLIRMCKVLNETPPAQLEAALSPLLDIDGALKFLAVDVALVNTDGYWTRASDYSIYQDQKRQFHVVPHDMNEALINEGRGGRGPGGPPPDFVRGVPPDARGGGPPGGGPPGGFPEMGRRGGRGPGGGGPDLDPLVGLNDPSKPLRSKLLAVPALRARYLTYVRDIAERWLDWRKVGPLVRSYQAVIATEVKLDTRKLYSSEAFESGLEGDENSLRSFVERRREYLLKVTDSRTPTK